MSIGKRPQKTGTNLLKSALAILIWPAIFVIPTLYLWIDFTYLHKVEVGLMGGLVLIGAVILSVYVGNVLIYYLFLLIAYIIWRKINKKPEKRGIYFFLALAALFLFGLQMNLRISPPAWLFEPIITGKWR